MKLNKNNKNKHKKLLILFAIIFILAIAGVSYYLLFTKNKNASSVSTTPGSNLNQEGINLNPPTEVEISDSENGKQAAGDSEPKNSQNNKAADGRTIVKPEISLNDVYNNNVEISANVQNIYENSGTCKLQLSKDGRTVTKSKKAVPNISYMSCGVIKIPVSEIGKGDWTGTVTYSSSKASGISDNFLVKIK